MVFSSLLQGPEGVSQALCGVGCCGEIAVGRRHLELQELGVDAGSVGTRQAVQDPVPDVAEGKDVAVDRARVTRRGVDHDLGGPEIQAGEVDLGLSAT